MVLITEDLIRKRAEHNECRLATLEEVSLHQLDIERIDHLDRWCRELKILYLQSNLIGRIENVSRLKKLEYLNLALNNILAVENLEGCESLNKLDLTVNFIGLVCSVERLHVNAFLATLYLTGNPCTEYVGYRDYVIASIPSLTQLDGVEITRSERILAEQQRTALKCEMLRQEKIYKEKQQKGDSSVKNDQWYTDTTSTGKKLDEKEDDFWNTPCKYTPESRLEAHRYLQEQQKEKENKKSEFEELSTPTPRVVRYFAEDDGRPLNINTGQLQFTLQEEDSCFRVDVTCYKYLDPNLIDVDIQPRYVRIIVKDKILQLAFRCDVSPDKSTARRSKVTGHLGLTLPKTDENVIIRTNNSGKKMNNNKEKSDVSNRTIVEKPELETDMSSKIRVEKLEITPVLAPNDILNIVNNKEEKLVSNKKVLNERKKEALDSFAENEDVPPLE